MTKQQIESVRRDLVHMLVMGNDIREIQEKDWENGLRRPHINGNLYSEIDKNSCNSKMIVER